MRCDSWAQRGNKSMISWHDWPSRSMWGKHEIENTEMHIRSQRVWHRRGLWDHDGRGGAPASTTCTSAIHHPKHCRHSPSKTPLPSMRSGKWKRNHNEGNCGFGGEARESSNKRAREVFQALQFQGFATYNRKDQLMLVHACEIWTGSRILFPHLDLFQGHFLQAV